VDGVFRVLSQICFFESFGVCKSLNFREPFSDITPRIEICDRTHEGARRLGLVAVMIIMAPVVWEGLSALRVQADYHIAPRFG
jgi:hypothetical protein